LLKDTCVRIAKLSAQIDYLKWIFPKNNSVQFPRDLI
jgi:hypothetical protein